MMKQERFKRIITVLGFTAILWMTLPPSGAFSKAARTMSEAYPEVSEGILKSAQLEKLDKGLLLKADGFEIRDSFFKEAFGKVDPEVQKELNKSKLFLLDQKALEELIKQDAKSMGIAMDPPDEQTFRAYFDRVTKDVAVSEEAVKSFYDENQEMVGGMPFDQVKESIKGFMLQKKQQEALQAHIDSLAEKAHMRINEDWVKKQVAIAGDNPLDRARRSGKPTLVQFSATGCAPCEMMKPIIEKLKKKYEGTINIVYIPVAENQILASRFHVQAVPVQVFFDKKGKQIHQHMGFMAEADILNQFKKMGVI